MKTGDFVWCKKDFYRQVKHLNYPKHAFHKGKQYKIFGVNHKIPVGILQWAVLIHF